MSDELSELKDLCDNASEPPVNPENIGMLRVVTANQWREEAASRPDPTPLWDEVWNEGEVCCLFADSNLGKSILAVQIAAEIAQRQKVVYFDFELSDKQFQLRYTDEYGNGYKFPDNLLRAEIDPDNLSSTNFEVAVMQDIEESAKANKANVLIIDNLTWLCNSSEKGDSAGELMKALMALKKRHGWSVLVIAHTPKRSLVSPITQNDLAGSKKLFNFFDSVFALGQSATDPSLRYIKQVKVRNGSFKYDSDNVLTCEIIKENGFTHFVMKGTATEKAHLKELNEKEAASQAEQAKQLKAQGKTQRQIADLLGTSLGKVNYLLKS